MLIKTPRHWFPNSIDVALTLAAWIGFLYLLARGIRGLLVQPDEELLSAIDLYMANHVHLFFDVALGIVALVVMWSKYQQARGPHRNSAAHSAIADQQALSSRFKISFSVLGNLRASQISVLHNDDQGNLAEVECMTEQQSPPTSKH